MFCKLCSDCFFREYENFAYLISVEQNKERIFDEVGAIFLRYLTYDFKNFDILVKEISDCFCDVTVAELKMDLIAFLFSLEKEGFVEFFDSKNLFEQVELCKINEVEKNSIGTTVDKFLTEYSKEHLFLHTLHIELTNKCNERCIHCYIPHEKKCSEISYKTLIDLLRQCKDMGVVTVIFSGGEVMLHPYFCELVKFAKELDLNVRVLTNLTILDDTIISALKYRHPTQVSVSLYSLNENIHDSITTIKGSCKRTMKNIEILKENGITVNINCPVIKQNKEYFDKVMEWGQSNGFVVSVDYLIMAKSDKSQENLKNRLVAEDIEKVVKKMVEHSDFSENGIRDEVKKNSDKYGEKICGVGLTTLAISADCNVYPCVGWQKYLCGNIEFEKLQDIWIYSQHLNYLRKLRRGNFQKCSICDDIEYCSMCMSRNSNEDPNGDIFNIPQITCDAAEIHHKVVEEYRKKLIVDSK